MKPPGPRPPLSDSGRGAQPFDLFRSTLALDKKHTTMRSAARDAIKRLEQMVSMGLRSISGLRARPSRVFRVAKPRQHLVGRHDITELLDDVFQSAPMFVIR